MEREKANFDILGRIDTLRLERGWTEYMLAESSGMAQSTISTWRRKNLQPNVASIEKICNGFGITLANFFGCDERDNLSDEQRSILNLWAKLSPKKRTALDVMIRVFLE